MGWFDFLRDKNPYAAPNPYRPRDMAPPPLLRRRPPSTAKPEREFGAQAGPTLAARERTVVPTPATTTPPPRAPSRPSGPSAAERAAIAAQQRAEAEARAAKQRAGQRFQNLSANLDPQIKALKQALDVEFKKGLDQNLEDIGTLIAEQIALLKTQTGDRALDFLTAAENTKQATAQQAEASLSNFARERADTMTAVLAQGAGQTDMLRALVGAARNYEANANEGNRAYFDTMQSINQSITDLNLDTQTALANVHSQGETERERLWQDYHNRRSESWTQLGNLYQQQADYLESAKEMEVGGGGGEKKGSAGDAFMKASQEAGKSYKKAALPDWMKTFKAADRQEAEVQNTNLSARPRFSRMRTNEGAALRRRAA